jgi:hypothetical protein
MKLALAPLAEARELEIDLWWRQQRPDAPDRFTEELLATLDWIEDHAEVPAVFEDIDGYPARRVLLKRSRQWVVYTVRHDDDVIVVETIWGTRRDELAL